MFLASSVIITRLILQEKVLKDDVPQFRFKMAKLRSMNNLNVLGIIYMFASLLRMRQNSQRSLRKFVRATLELRVSREMIRCINQLSFL